MHDVCIIFACKNETCTTHIGSELVDLIERFCKLFSNFLIVIAKIPCEADAPPYSSIISEITDDEFIKGAAVKDKLPRLKPAFKKEGTVTPGNASGINDGASAMVVTSEDYAKDNGLKPLARIKSWATAGCRPDRMGLGPAFAIPIALERAGIAAEDVDLYEINEAFAAQFLAVKQELDLDPDRTNVNGGAIALGHPLGASGNRVLLTLIRELQRRKKSIGVASLCIGGGQGIAMVVEAM